MKLTYYQLETQIAKLAKVYLISGEEPLLKLDAVNLIRKAAKKAEYIERIRLNNEAGYDWEELYTLLYSTSLLQEKRLIELDFRDGLPNKVASNILANYTPEKTNHLLLIELGKVETKTSKSAWFQTLEKHGIHVPIWPLNNEQFPQWIMHRAKKYKLALDLKAANLLADYVQGNLVAAAQLVEKLYLLKADKIDESLLYTLLSDESRFTVFDYIENLISGNHTQVLRILKNLEEEGVEPILILWGITRELRLLADFSQQIQQGVSFESIAKKQRLFSRRKTAIQRFLNHHTVKDCCHFLAQAAHIDKTIKGAFQGNVWEMLALFSLRVMV